MLGAVYHPESMEEHPSVLSCLLAYWDAPAQKRLGLPPRASRLFLLKCLGRCVHTLHIYTCVLVHRCSYIYTWVCSNIPLCSICQMSLHRHCTPCVLDTGFLKAGEVETHLCLSPSARVTRFSHHDGSFPRILENEFSSHAGSRNWVELSSQPSCASSSCPG